MADDEILVKVKYDTDDAVKEVDELTSSLEGLSVEQASLKNQLDKGKISQTEYSTAVAKNKEQISKETKERKAAIKVIQTEKNSRDGIKASITKLKQARDKLDTTNKKEIKQIKVLNKQIDKQNKKLGNTKSKTEGLSGVITSLVPGLSGAGSAMQKFGAVSKLALLPLSLIIGAIAALIAFFKRSEEGQDRLNKIMTVAKTIMGNLGDAFSDFGRVVLDSIVVLGARFQKFFGKVGLGWQKLKGVFTENSEAIQEQQRKIAEAEANITAKQEIRRKSLGQLKDGITGIIDETKREIDIAKDLADRQNQLIKDTRNNLVTEAGLRRDVANIRAEAADKENLDAQTRLELLDEAIALENVILDNAQKLAKERLALKVIENNLAESTREDLEEQAQLEAALIALETSNANARRKLLSERLTAERELKSEQRTIEIEAEKAFNEEIDEINKELDEENLLRIAELERIELESEERKIDMAIASADRRKDIFRESVQFIGNLSNDLANLLISSNNNRLDKELSAEEAKRDKALTLAGNDAAKKEKIEQDFEAKKLKLQKKAAKDNQKIQIANAIVQGAIVVLNALATTPFVPLGLLAAVGAGLATAVQIATIKQQSFAKGGQAHLPKAARGAQMTTLGGATHAGGGVQLSADGVPFAEAQRDENVYVVNKNASDYINSLSDINQRIGGGVPLSRKSGFMQDGGQADIENNQPDINDITARVLKNLPPIIVQTVDIKTGLENREDVVNVGVV